jgi:hypothetical protein
VTKQTKAGKGRLNRWGKLGCPVILQIVVVVSAIVFQFQCRAQISIYQFSAPINGWFQQGAADPSGGANGLHFWGGVGDIFNYGALSETLYYNSSSDTLQQVGSFTLGSTSFSGSFEDDKYVNGSLVHGMVSVSYTLNNGNNTVSFNSGTQPIGSNLTLDWSIPFSETITLTTGGQNYSDTITGAIPEANDMTRVSQFSANSIVISQGYQNLSMNIGEQYFANFNATDGWSGTIADGFGDQELDDYYYLAPITAYATPVYATPEPDNLIIFALGTLGLGVFLRRKYAVQPSAERVLARRPDPPRRRAPF